MNPRLTRRLIVAGIILLLVGMPLLWFARQYRQEKLDHALITAIRQQDVNAVVSLLFDGADPNTRDTREKQHLAPEVLKTLFHPVPQCLDSRSALFLALDSSTHRIASALISAGADVNEQDKKSDSVLMYAACVGNTEVVSALAAGGADVNHRDNDGETALIDCASDMGDAATLEVLIAGGAEVNAKDNKGDTALHGATHRHDEASVNALISAGADVNAKDNHGDTPLSMSKGRSEIVGLLKAAGAKE